MGRRRRGGGGRGGQNTAKVKGEKADSKGQCCATAIPYIFFILLNGLLSVKYSRPSKLLPWWVATDAEILTVFLLHEVTCAMHSESDFACDLPTVSP